MSATVTIFGRTTNPQHAAELAKYKQFESWEAVLEHVGAKKKTFYFPPMNYMPAQACAKRVGDKIRITVAPKDGDSFWADAGHLDRFLYQS